MTTPTRPKCHACSRRAPRAALRVILACLLPVLLASDGALAAAPEAGQLAQQQARLHVAHAKRLIADEAYGPALDALRKAARLDPTNAACRRLLEQARAKVQMRTGQNVIQPITEQYAARARSVVRQAEFSLFEAQQALDKTDYERAVQQARKALAAIGYIVSTDRSALLRTRAAKILAAAQRALKGRRELQQQRDLEKARADGLAERQRHTAIEAGRYKSLREKGWKLYGDGHYDDALAAAREVLRGAPHDTDARFLEEKALKASLGPEDLRGRSPLRRQRENQLMARLEDELKPHPNAQVVLPGKAARTKKARLRFQPTEPWERDLRAKLTETVHIDFKQTPLKDCVEQLAAISKVNIVLDPSAAAETPITLGNTNMPLDALLRWVARFAGLRYCLRDGAVFLTTERGMLDEPIRAVYDVSTLIIPEEDAVPTAVIDASLIGMRGPLEPFYRRPASAKPLEVDTDAIGEGWADFLRNTIAPGTWDARPDEDTLQEQPPRYTIQYRNGRIVVLHTPDVHRQIEELLDHFRRARSLQVHILGRFLEISKTYLEQLTLGSFNWFADDVTGPGRSYWGGKRYAFPYVGLTNLTDIIQEVADPLDPEADPIAQPLARFPELTSQGGLSLGWDYEGLLRPQFRGNPTQHLADAILNAVLKQQKGALLSAPRITCFNTQRANIQVLINRNYVRRISSDEEPEIGNVPEGMIFDVQPFVSADRRYITLVLQPQQRTLVAMTTYSFSTGIDDTLPPGWEGPIPTVGRTIQVPTTRLRSIGTTVTVPNGGTLIAGGFNEVEERQGTAGIPFIESIPVLKHIFRGCDSAEGRRSLILMVTAQTVRDIFTEE